MGQEKESGGSEEMEIVSITLLKKLAIKGKMKTDYNWGEMKPEIAGET